MRLPAVPKSASIREALEAMRERGLYHVLVLEEDGSVAGIVSVVDMARRLVEDLEAAGDVERVDAVRRFLETRVEDIETRPVIIADADITLRDAARIMYSRGIGCLPLSRDDTIVGAVCEPDVVAALAEEPLRDPVYNHSTRRLVYAEDSDTVWEALGVMTEGGFRRLPVLARGALAGVTTIHMLVKAVTENPEALYESIAPRHLREATTIDPRDPVPQAAARILVSGVGAVLLTVGGVPAGIFTERDAVRVYAEKGDPRRRPRLEE